MGASLPAAVRLEPRNPPSTLAHPSREGRDRRRRWAACLGAAFLLCASACESDARKSWSGSGRVVVAPVNLTVEFDHELEDSLKPIHDEIVRQLQQQPRARVAIIFEPEARALWHECLGIVRSSSELPNSLETALAVFARELGDHDEFDLLLIPSLAWRHARVTGRTARWDGVKRRVSVRGAPRSRPDADANLFQNGLAETTGLSLHISALTPTGTMVHRGWGGLDIVHDVVPGGRRGSGRATLVLRRNPLKEPAHLREGVALALGPYGATQGP